MSERSRDDVRRQVQADRELMHTPGPWEIFEVHSGGGKDRGLVYAFIRAPKGQFAGTYQRNRIGTGQGVGFASGPLSREQVPDAESLANARLIAAAPDLLAADREALAALYGAREALGHIGNIDLAIDMLTAAIAKAEGRS